MLNSQRPAARTRRPPSLTSREARSFGRQRSNTTNSSETAFPINPSSPPSGRHESRRQLGEARERSHTVNGSNNSGPLSPARTRWDFGSAATGQQFWTPGRQQLAQRAQLGLGGRAEADEYGAAVGTQRKRSMTVQGAHMGYVGADPGMPVEECTKRIDMLLERVQSTHRRLEAHMALKSPTATATRFDVSGPSPPMRPGRRQVSSSTVSTLSLEDSERSGESVGEPCGARRRAATMDHGVRSKVSSTLVDSQGTKPEEKPIRPPVTTTATATGAPRRTTTAEVRMKLEKLRARRAARLEATEGSQTGSPRPGDSPKQAEQQDEKPDFFDDQEVINLFQEIPLPLKDAEWDKRVYYFHVAQTNAQFRAATEEATVGDYRKECLVDLLGEHVAEKVIRMDQSSGSETVDDDEVDRIAAWMDEDEDVGGANAYRSFDWSRDGFGYMEFRKQSKASLVGSSVMSPGDSRRGLAGLNARSRVISPPAARRQPRQQQPRQQQRSTTPDIDFPMDLPNMSLMDAESSSDGHMLSPMATTNAMAMFGEAIPTAQRQRGARPTTVYADNMFDNLECDGRLDGEQDGDWELVASVDKETKRARISSLAKENQQLRDEIRVTRQVIAALTRVVVKQK
ncbi:hypothetical protein FBU59_000140 [Linderina macrospora]|uniref:Uncharacterized protein n=1 Tax=Linderina macrospora TaxID=4868 RepID=A0ACC1JHZ2_9FUNG|nr:hypothetical protein FBU59_000140 [Linderina macrospora]